MTQKIRILLVEDDENLGFMLRDNLELTGYEVVLQSNGAHAVTAFHNDFFQLCILDVMLPGKDGFTIADEIRKYDLNIPIIFLTARSNKDDRIKGFKSGADDYVTKPFSIEEFLLRIESLLKRVYARPTSSDQKHLLKFGNSSFNVQSQQLNISGSNKKLTVKESRVLTLLARNKNQLVERDLILKSVWEDDGYFVARSMDVFISKLRKYLKEDRSLKLVNIHGLGYKLEEDLSETD